MPGSSRELQTGVVGIGARCYLAAFVDSSPVPAQLVVAVDTAPDAVERIQRLPSEGVVAVADHCDLLGFGISAIVLATLDDMHEELACFFLKTGIPVYLKKPLTITIEAIDHILETARCTDTRLYAGHSMHHMEVVRLLKSIIDSGRVGEVEAVWYRHFVDNSSDYYFRDWHAECRHVTGLLLQKTARNVNVMSWLTYSAPAHVVGTGRLMVYGEVERCPTGISASTVMQDQFSLGHWPADEVDGLNPAIDVEDHSMLVMTMCNGAMTSYQQHHLIPDYWRSYTAIDTRGRVENLGDGADDVVKVWTERTEHYAKRATQEYVIAEEGIRHDSADQLAIGEFPRFVRDGGATEVSPVSTRDAIAVGVLATRSLRSDSVPFDVPELDVELAAYFRRGQHNPYIPTESS